MRKFIETNYQKITSQEGRLLNFLKPLMSVGLPLIKNVLPALVKSVLVSSRLMAAASEKMQLFKKIFSDQG